MNELLLILWSWACVLMGAPIEYANKMPPVKFVSHEYLVANACNGQECRVVGWYPGGTVYIDQALDITDTHNSSIVVHEFIHALQYERDKVIGPVSCEQHVEYEKEAYGHQGRYLMFYGRLPSGLPKHFACV